LLWKYDMGRAVKATPIVIDGKLVIGSLNKRLNFIEVSSGKEIGYYKVTSSVSTSACGDGGKVYFAWDNLKDNLYALNLQQKRVQWKERIGNVSASPVLWGNSIFVGTGEGTMWVLDKTSGQTVWQFGVQNSIFSTPACLEESKVTGSDSVSLDPDEKVICFGSIGGYLYALKAGNGELIWKFQAGGGIYSSPAVDREMIFFGSVDGDLYALNSKDGSLVWRFKTEAAIYSSPAVTDSLVYIGSNDYCMYAVKSSSGEVSWKFKTEGLVHSSPIAVGDKLFFGSFDGNFYVLNRFTGKLLWRYQTEGMISASPAYYDGKIYIGSEDGYLYCFGR
ncbi:MAG TPA: PQQ-binding-like beta-propeller repeat protein, partial [candidate division Zixibacteria bacterium]